MKIVVTIYEEKIYNATTISCNGVQEKMCFVPTLKWSCCSQSFVFCGQQASSGLNKFFRE